MPSTHRSDGVRGGITRSAAPTLQRIVQPEGTTLQGDDLEGVWMRSIAPDQETVLTREASLLPAKGMILPSYGMVLTGYETLVTEEGRIF